MIRDCRRCECTNGLRFDEARRQLGPLGTSHDLVRLFASALDLGSRQGCPCPHELRGQSFGFRESRYESATHRLQIREGFAVEIQHGGASSVRKRDHGATACERRAVHEVFEPCERHSKAVTRLDQPKLAAKRRSPRTRERMRRCFELAQDGTHVAQRARNRTLSNALGTLDQSLDAAHDGCEYTRRVSVVPTTISTEASYRTLLTLAVGGMGQVDLAVRREGNFERLFAIKRLRPELSSDADVRSMFLDETRIAGLIRHPNVVSIVDVGEDETGPLAVMEFVDGISVAELLAEKEVHPLPLDLALRIALQVAEGLHAAHELRASDGSPLELVHRDVSPQNILLGFDGIARVTDFGVAKALGRISQTSTGVLKGKLGYISPEQLRFEEPDRRADLFALGVVLFELLTGQRLYRSQESMDGPRRILTEPPPDLADYRDDAEPELVALLFELLAKQREARPESAKQVARRIESILATLLHSSTQVDTSEFLEEHFADRRSELEDRIHLARSRPISRRPRPRSLASRAWPWAALVGVAMVAGAAGFWLLRPNDPVADVEASEGNPAPSLPEAAVVAETLPVVAAPPPSGSMKPAKRVQTKKPTKGGVPMWENY